MLICKNITTERGFKRLEFTDVFGSGCSVQESSIVGEPTIWLGYNNARMLLNQEMAKGLIVVLNDFIRNGDLSSNARSL